MAVNLSKVKGEQPTNITMSRMLSRVKEQVLVNLHSATNKLLHTRFVFPSRRLVYGLFYN